MKMTELKAHSFLKAKFFSITFPSQFYGAIISYDPKLYIS